jgi:Glycosyltransferase family 87
VSWLTHSGSRVAIACLLAAVVRLAALPLPGTEDTGTWKIWMFAASADVTNVYGRGGAPPTRGILEWQGLTTTVDYPPVALYELGVAGRVYRWFDPAFADGVALTVATKLPGLACGIGLTALLWWAVHRHSGSQAAAHWAALAYWANPAAILNGEVLGYLDPLMMLPAIGMLVLLHEQRPALAGAAFAIALLTKPQAILLAPILALAAWRLGGSRALARAAVGAAVAAAGAALPFAVAGALPNMWLAFGSFYARRDILSGNAANLWWIVTYALRAWYQIPRMGVLGAYLAPVRRILAITTLEEIGLPNPRPFGTALVLGAGAWSLWRVRHARHLALHALGAAFVVHAFFVLGVGIHEHHMMLALPLLVLAAALQPGIRPLFYIVSAIIALNMNLFYGLGYGVGWGIPRGLLLIDLSVLLAIANVVALAWHGRILAREAARVERERVAA